MRLDVAFVVENLNIESMGEEFAVKFKLEYALEMEEEAHIYMLFAGWEVRIVKNCDRGLENAARGRN